MKTFIDLINEEADSFLNADLEKEFTTYLKKTPPSSIIDAITSSGYTDFAKKCTIEEFIAIGYPHRATIIKCMFERFHIANREAFHLKYLNAIKSMK